MLEIDRARLPEYHVTSFGTDSTSYQALTSIDSFLCYKDSYASHPSQVQQCEEATNNTITDGLWTEGYAKM